MRLLCELVVWRLPKYTGVLTFQDLLMSTRASRASNPANFEYNDELPYWVEVEGKRHLVVPYTLGVNDSKFGRGVFATGEDFYTYAKDSFDMLYREGEGQPKMMSVGLHMRIIGHPGRAAGLERFLDHVLQHNGVWVCRREEIAQHWMSHHSA